MNIQAGIGKKDSVVNKPVATSEPGELNQKTLVLQLLMMSIESQPQRMGSRHRLRRVPVRSRMTICSMILRSTIG